MKKDQEADSHEVKQDSSEEVLTRRKAIKRIAAIFAGAAVTTKALGQSPAFGQEHFAYLSKAPIFPYADSVYASRQPSYQRYISYYTSYRSHYTSVPPPYSSRK